MKDFCILSDFDGTITTKDGLYTFIEMYANDGWERIEQDWSLGKISSKECLIDEFKLIPKLNKKLIEDFIQNTITIDESFKDFYNYINKNNIDFYVVSDGCDYFIEKIFAKYNLKNIKIISNHGEFIDNKFEWSFPNDSKNCSNNAGTCKCEVVKNMRNKYQQIYYIGDGTSDFCVANKVDVLYAKNKLQNYCETKNIKYKKYEAFDDIQKELENNLILLN